MKNLITLILLFLAANIQAQPDTCHPTFKEIYDFNVGDVFVYEGSSFYGGFSAPTTWSSVTKSEIVNKKDMGDTIVYYLKVIKATTQTEYRNTMFGQISKHTYCNQYSDSIVYIDSIDHILNKCNIDSIYKNYINYHCNHLILSSIDSISKIISYSDTFSTLNKMSEIYKIGIGRISSSYSAFEGSGRDTLIAYIKNKDTVGLIVQDSVLFKYSIQNSVLSDCNIYPNPAHSNFTIELPMEYEACQVELISADGSVVLTTLFLNAGQNLISTGNVAPGFYVVRVNAGKNVLYKKMIIN